MKVRTIIDGIETVMEMEKPMATEEPKKKRGRPRKDALEAGADLGRVKRRGRPPKAANGSFAALLAALRDEREKLIDKVSAIGTAIEALEALA